ncbi:MAG: tripartite tricarboxylate transporter substrate binding protein, partial [Betaproteobacteria bacterium]|nr:tripartite tricarboxylate transporter substrate binding protein [Betaproteobacteria bacterium]
MKPFHSAVVAMLVSMLLNPQTVSAQKQVYPSQPVRLVITHAAGGTTD